MAETKVSRRSTRVFDEEHCNIDIRGTEERGRVSAQRGSGSSTNSLERPQAKLNQSIIQLVDLGNLGKDTTATYSEAVEDKPKVHKIIQKETPHERMNGQPVNFGIVAPGIYRSSFPESADFEYLSTLGLKTIVSLVQKDFAPEFQSFMATNGINHRIIDMDGTKKVAIPIATMRSIMELVLDKSNSPLLIHCNHGKHRTGCTVAVLRLVSRWNSVEDIVKEYEDYATPKIRDCDVSYIRAFQLSSLDGISGQQQPPPKQISSVKSTVFRLILGSAAAVFICYTTWSSFSKA